jgi:hypothetical protein
LALDPAGRTIDVSLHQIAGVIPMAEIKEALVPDIGDYSDIPVIEVLVAVGDTVKKG